MKQLIAYFSVILTYFICCSPNISTAQTDTLAIYFRLNDATINDASATLIRRFAAAHSSTEQIRIFGYADSTGSKGYNNTLSYSRAKNVESRLIAVGVNRSGIIVCMGKGAVERQGGKTYADIADDRKVLIIGDRTGKHSKNAAVPKSNALIPEVFTPYTNLATADTGTTFILNNITFDPSDDHLKPDAKPQLDDLYSAMALNLRLKIKIEGHICCPATLIKYDNLFSGTIDDMVTHDTSHAPITETLSLGRAKAVYNYLIKNGIDSGRITCEGFGTTRPLVPETSEDNAQKNRRIQFRVVEN